MTAGSKSGLAVGAFWKPVPNINQQKLFAGSCQPGQPGRNCEKVLEVLNYTRDTRTISVIKVYHSAEIFGIISKLLFWSIFVNNHVGENINSIDSSSPTMILYIDIIKGIYIWNSIMFHWYMFIYRSRRTRIKGILLHCNILPRQISYIFKNNFDSRALKASMATWQLVRVDQTLIVYTSDRMYIGNGSS